MIERVQAEATRALRAGDRGRVGALRLILAALQTAAKRDGGITEGEQLAVLRRERKQRVEAAETYAAAGRPDRAEGELYEAGVIDEFLPAALDRDALERLVDAAVADSGATGMRDMGRVMALVAERSGGAADPTAAAGLARARLGG
ncbi:MAG TPA: GatB/YqeY domain-containing protein [Gaiellales bacterium]|nr:GatB/YqeY domain-containing protein [Gaiellales bacterium]